MFWKPDPACSILNQPDFADDPGGYFDWIDGCYGDRPEAEEVPPVPPVPPCRPSRWRDPIRQCCWQVVCGPFGPEVIPCFENACLVVEPGTIQAIQISPDGFRVRIATDGGSEVVTVERDQAPIRGLAGAMVTGTVVGRELTAVAPDRWRELAEAFSRTPRSGA
jgi:hypothetical protein